MILLLFIILSYLIGSISFSILLGKCLGLPDPRQQGSGNPGATNVFRSGHRSLAAVVLIGDIAKAVLPLLLAQSFGFSKVSLAWIAVFIVTGHLFPIFFQFRGGKGVATALGSLFVIAWPVALYALGTWLTVFSFSRYASLASVIAAMSTLFSALWLVSLSVYFPISLIALLIISRHTKNLVRLWYGAELRIQ